jgi:hypothetical protein
MTDAIDRLASALADRRRMERALAERYTLEREQGRRGMAAVCLARDVTHDRRRRLPACWAVV